jgi:hypothetical protein
MGVGLTTGDTDPLDTSELRDAELDVNRTVFCVVDEC